MMKKNIAKLLVFAMLLSMLPFAAAAAEPEETAAPVSISDCVTINDVKVSAAAVAAQTLVLAVFVHLTRMPPSN